MTWLDLNRRRSVVTVIMKSHKWCYLIELASCQFIACGVRRGGIPGLLHSNGPIRLLDSVKCILHLELVYMLIFGCSCIQLQGKT